MKKNQEVSRREKSAAVGLVICFVAMIAIVGMVTFGRYERKSETELAQTEEDKQEVQQEQEVPQEETQITNSEQIQSELQEEVITEAPDIPIVEDIADTIPSLAFSPGDMLVWPVEGNVILNYSMDQTIYFSTLDQYKYNPALVISGEVGAEVLAAAAGEVMSIQEDVQTGTTVTVSLGDGYEAVYGQLKDVCVQQGDRMQQGDLLGYLNEPTKYYSVEGCNLYFQLLKNGEPVNPMEYMEA